MCKIRIEIRLTKLVWHLFYELGRKIYRFHLIFVVSLLVYVRGREEACVRYKDIPKNWNLKARSLYVFLLDRLRTMVEHKSTRNEIYVVHSSLSLNKIITKSISTNLVRSFVGCNSIKGLDNRAFFGGDFICTAAKWVSEHNSRRQCQRFINVNWKCQFSHCSWGWISLCQFIF